MKAIENPSEEQLEKAKFLADKLFENIKKMRFLVEKELNQDGKNMQLIL
ncbi:MAG: hypothetical protein ACLVBP_12345 [Ruminococcus sp.]